MSTLSIKDLHVQVEDKEILKGLSLVIREGETHALMGPNGNGKSTLLAAIMAIRSTRSLRARSCWTAVMYWPWMWMKEQGGLFWAAYQASQRRDHSVF